VAFELLRAVASEGAYANLLLPKLIASGGPGGRALDARDAALATELGYGTLRATGTLDAVLARCLDRPPAELEPAVLDLARLGAYQALRTRIPPHAAVHTTVELARTTGHARVAGLLNAVLRKVVAADWNTWCDRLAVGQTTHEGLALRYAHPEWIVDAFAEALDSPEPAELVAALAADDTRPQTHLVAWPDRLERAELVRLSGGQPGPWSPYAVRMDGGDPGQLAAVRDHQAAVQDEGSQLCALALADAGLTGPDEQWLDLCAGPGGKAALLAALAGQRSAELTANELHPHRAELVAQALAGRPVRISVGDARQLPGGEPGYDRVLLDAPCTGLGALRRRPEARWRRQPADVTALAQLQTELLAAALRLVRPGGLVGYVTCSPHPAETVAVVAGAVADGAQLLDARPYFPGVAQLGPGPTVQLWPHRHGTDAMFFALLRRPVRPA
jgi:16S rRNA (cytosine967-C5)-methyltransferase